MTSKMLQFVVAVCVTQVSFGQNMRGSDATSTVAPEDIKDVLVGKATGLVMPWAREDDFIGAHHVHEEDAASSLSRGLSLEGKARLDEFRSGLKTTRLDEFRSRLKTTFLALPKDGDGRLEHQTARYALHRFFVQRHSWSIKGLENGDTWHRNKSLAAKEWVPSYLLSLMTEKLGRHGLELEDLAALGVALEDLIRKEASGTLEDVWKARKMEGWVGPDELHMALKSYMVLYLGSGAWGLKKALTNEFFQKHTYWNATEEWLRSVEADELTGTGEAIDFATAARIAGDIGARYGPYNDVECQKIKTTLMGGWAKGKATGRVRLVDFYRMGFELEEFNFAEKPEFLRAMGALDDSNASNPMVIIPNYVSAQPNCLQATSIYAVCCRNECEDIMMKIEEGIASPTATPEQLVGLVSSLSSPTVAAPRELPPIMKRRLEDMAARYGGSVNIHGRLFAQWMHHAFPSECPYPREAGTIDTVSPDDWQSEDLEASEEERRRHVAADTCSPEQAAAEWVVELPWSDAEELVSSQAMMKMQGTASARHESTCLAVIFVLASIGLAVALTFAPPELRLRCFAAAKNPRVLMLGTLVTLAFVTNAVNRSLLALIVAGGLLLKMVSAAQSATAKVVAKEKSMV